MANEYYEANINFYLKGTLFFNLINRNFQSLPVHPPIPRIGERVFFIGVRYFVTDVAYEYRDKSVEITVLLEKDGE